MEEYLPYIIALIAVFSIYKFFAQGNTQPRRPDANSTTQPKTSSNEREVCEANEVSEGGMKEIECGESGKILLVKQKGEFYAVGNKCTHSGASLSKGALGEGRIRCPWHGACFNLKTGDIEDYPCVDAIHTFPTRVANNKVFVTIDQNKVTNHKRTPVPAKLIEDKRTFVVLGGGPAGLTCCQTLRQEGFGGKIIMISKENHLPYDRTKLSKSMTSALESMILRPAEFFKQNNIETKLGAEVKELDASTKTVTLTNGETLQYDTVLIATGGNPRTLPVNGMNLQNIYQLRTPEDSAAITNSVYDKKVVIVGTSFIGMEAASCIASRASSVVAIGMESVPFERVLGVKIGTVLQQLHQNNQIQFRLKKVVKEFKGQEGKVSAVVLDDGEELPADICIIGAGIVPATDYIKPNTGITIERDKSVVVDKYLQAAEGVYAVGDLARYPFHLTGELIRVEHYGMSQLQGHLAALNFLGKNKPLTNIPFFWTTQYAKRLTYAGHALTYDDVIIDGDLDAMKFVAYYVKGSQVLAVAALNRDPIASLAAELMASGKMPTAEQIKSGNFLK